MKYSAPARQVFFFISAIIYSTFLLSQECAVEKESLKGTYTGDCKNGRANGRGKAVGTDTYEGEFKSGLPDGQGTYIWNNGSSYTGKFAKGFKDGKGTMVYKRANAADSVFDGFWKKDLYVGKYEKPYLVYFKSKSVTDVEIEVKRNSFKQISFFITNTSGGGVALDGSENPKMKVDDIQLTKGAFGRTMANNDHAKKSETIIYDIVFPIRMKVTIGSEQVEIEFNEEASYVVNIRINE
jgi:hypothetical protein